MKEHVMEFSQRCPKFYVFPYPGEPNTFTQFHNEWESSLLNLIIYYPVCAFLFWTYLNSIPFTKSIASQHEKKQILETKWGSILGYMGNTGWTTDWKQLYFCLLHQLLLYKGWKSDIPHKLPFFLRAATTPPFPIQVESYYTPQHISCPHQAQSSF